MLVLFLQGCKATPPPSGDPLAYKNRTKSSINEDVTVTIAVPTIAEARAIYGVKRVDFKTLYTAEEIINIEDENELRRVLEELPCCTTNADGDEYGDPLNLVLIGEPSDMVPALVRGNWLSPIRFRGKQIFVGQISRDIGVKFTLKSPTISTHVIDPDVDEARRYFVEDLAYSQALARAGYVNPKVA